MSGTLVLDAVDDEGCGLQGKLQAVRVITEASTQCQWSFPDDFEPLGWDHQPSGPIKTEHIPLAAKFEVLHAVNWLVWTLNSMDQSSEPLAPEILASVVTAFDFIRTITKSTMDRIERMGADRRNPNEMVAAQLLDTCWSVAEVALLYFGTAGAAAPQ